MQSDLDGPPMPKCKECGAEHNEECGWCDECQAAIDMIEEMRAGKWPSLPKIEPITTKLK